MHAVFAGPCCGVSGSVTFQSNPILYLNRWPKPALSRRILNIQEKACFDRKKGIRTPNRKTLSLRHKSKRNGRAATHRQIYCGRIPHSAGRASRSFALGAPPGEIASVTIFRGFNGRHQPFPLTNAQNECHKKAPDQAISS